MPSPIRIARPHARACLASLSALGLALLGGCASTPSTPAVYCVNAPGAGTPPPSVQTAYCINLPHRLSALSTRTAASPPAPAAEPAGPAAAPSVPPASANAVASTAPSVPTESAPSPAPSENAQAAGSAAAANAYRAPHGVLTLAPNVDLDRFMGRWYVIAFIPYAFENGRVGAYYEFRKRDDGKIDFDYYSRRHDFDHDLDERKGRAYVVKNTHDAKWRVTFTWPIYTSFPILYVAPDYGVALIGYPRRSLGWVLSRSPQMDDTTYQALLARFAAQGYDTSQFSRVPQSQAQLNAQN